MEPFLGEIRMFGGNFEPKDWMFCNGQLLNIAGNTALFSVIGNKFGGNGTTTFALPNLIARTPMGVGQGTGLTARALGELGGSDTYTLDRQSTPAHSHTLKGALNLSDTASPKGTYFGSNAPRTTGKFAAQPTDIKNLVSLGETSIKATGDALPVNNIQPSLVVTYIIAIRGMLPPR